MKQLKIRERRSNDLRTAMLFLLPNFFGLLAFVVFPVGFSLVMAFTNWDLARREPFAFTGFDNFKGLLWGEHAGAFWKYFLNTLYFMMGLPLSIAGSLLLALGLHKPIQVGKGRWSRLFVGLACLIAGFAGAVLLWSAGRGDAAFAVVLFTGTGAVGLWAGNVFFRTLFYLPQFTAGVAMYILWRSLFNPDFGLINHGLRFILPDAPQWLLSVRNLWGMDPEHVTPALRYFGIGARDAIVFMGVWMAMGGANMLLYLAGLANVPPELYEVAELDGAGRWAKFRHVTWPQLAPTTFFIIVMATIGGLQGGFEQARVMTAGGPADTTVTLGYYIYKTGFQEFRLGLASAISWIMFVLVFAMTLLHWRFGKRGLEG